MLSSANSLLCRLGGFDAPGIIARRSINRRDFSTHWTNVGTQLTAMMDRVEEKVPEELAQGRFPVELSFHQQPCLFLPGDLVHPPNPVVQSRILLSERGQDGFGIGRRMLWQP